MYSFLVKSLKRNIFIIEYNQRLMNSKLSKFDFSSTIYILFGFFILSWVLWYNGYPLVYSDTGIYIAGAHEHFIPGDRPQTYGEFIYVFGMHKTLWGPILMQTLMLAFVLFDLCMIITKHRSKKTIYLVTCILLAFTSGISFTSSQLMADVFTPMLFIALANITFRVKSRPILDFLNVLIGILAIGVHNSHVAIAILLLVIFFGLMLAQKKIASFNIFLFTRLKTIKIVFLLVVGVLFTPTLHFLNKGEFVYSGSSHVILMCKFVENGTLKAFLKEKCQDKKFYETHKMCSCYEELPIDISSFLWLESSPLHKTGGWGEASKKEYNDIIKELLTTPKYLYLNITSTIENTLSQLFRLDVAPGTFAYLENSPPYARVHQHYEQEGNSYDLSLQNVNHLKKDWVTELHHYAIFFTVLLIIIIWKNNSKFKKEQIAFMSFAVLYLLLNSLCTAGLHDANPRFQSRVDWIIQLSVLIIVLDNLKTFKKIVQSAFD